MASRKLTQLPTATEVTASDKIYIVDVSDTSESPQGTSKQAVISELPSSGITTLTSTDGSIDIDLTDPDAPDLSVVDYAIPLAGTETGANVTGDIVVNAGVRVKTESASGTTFNSFYLDDGGVQMQADGGGGQVSSVSLGTSNLDFNCSNSAQFVRENSRYLASISIVDPTTTAPEAIGLLNIQGTTIYISTGSTDPSDWKQIFPSL